MKSNFYTLKSKKILPFMKHAIKRKNATFLLLFLIKISKNMDR